MSDMNVCVFTGRLGGEPKSKEVNGKQVIQFRLAVRGRKDSTLWLTCEQWNPGGVVQFLEKGTQVSVSGELETRTWTGQDGQERSATQVTVRQLTLLGSPKRESERQPSVVQGTPMRKAAAWEGDDTPF